MIKILFICGSLEPGRDGVGDYTRKLASALINRNHKTAIIAINDRRMADAKVTEEKQYDNNTEMPVLRLSSSMSWKSRLTTAKNYVTAFDPDWISVQYVPFGYQIKGLPFNLGGKIKSIGLGNRWHVMFHELSVDKNESLKFRAWAFFQVRIIQSLLKSLRPALITTNTKMYQQRLQKKGYATGLLPLFSNIGRIDSNHQTEEGDIPEYLLKNRDEYIIATLFGNFAFRSWNLCSLLDKFSNGHKGKKVIVSSIGKMPSGNEYWERLKIKYPHIIFLTLGVHDEAFISCWLSNYTDFGILTTPPELAGKSGSFMAFKEHGIPVVCRERSFGQEGFKTKMDKVLTEINSGEFILPPRYVPISVLQEVTVQFINALSMANGQQLTIKYLPKPMLKILILSHHFDPEVGGIETNSQILASAFHDLGAEVHVLTWTKDKSRNHFPFTIIRSPDLSTLLREHRRADIVFENNPCLRLSWPNIFIRRPLIIAVNTWVNRIKGNKGIRDKLKQLWFRRAINVIAVSDAVRRKEWKPAVVIENPYNNHLFKIIPGIQRTVPFVFLGRLVSDKAADQAIQAVSVLVNEKMLDKNQVQLTIIGDGPERQRLLSLSKKLGLEKAVQLTGILKGEALVDCLNRHRFILVPSSWEEPYGNVVLEGMACGCIPITSDGGGLPEAVGKAGFIFKRNDLNALVNILKKVLCDKSMTEAINKNASPHLAKHSVEIVTKKYFQILKEAVAEG